MQKIVKEKKMWLKSSQKQLWRQQTGDKPKMLLEMKAWKG